MPAFSKIQAEKIVAPAPSHTVKVPLAAFQPRWRERPKGEVEMGLRLIADPDLEVGRARAGKRATELHPRAVDGDPHLSLWWDAYNDELMRWIIALGTCSATDATKAWPNWKAAPEMMVREALTSDGVGHIYDAWERMRIEADPSLRPVRDEELAAIGSLIAASGEQLSKMDRGRATSVRRLLRHCIEELTVES